MSKVFAKYFSRLLMMLVLLCQLWIIFSPQHLRAQGNAEELYKDAQKASSTEEKINLLAKAIEADPTFIQAYLELGFSYKEKGDFQKALIHFRRTLVANPEKLTRIMRFQVVYETGAIQMSLGQLAQAKESFMAAERLTNDKISKSDIYFQLGEINTALNLIDDAVGNYSTGKILNPEDSRFDKKITKLRQEKQLYEFYLEGNKNLSQAHYAEAIAAFEKVVNLNPDFKDTIAKLEEARTKLNKEKELNSKQNLEQIYTEDQSFLEPGRESGADKKFQEILIDAPSKNNESMSAQTPNVQQERKRGESNNNLEQFYRTAILNFNLQNWPIAIQNFELILNIDPNFRDVPTKLGVARQRFNEQIEMEELETAKKQLYNAALEAIENKDWSTATERLQRLLNLAPNYREARILLEQAKFTLADSSNMDWKESLYTQGLAYVNQDNWLEARVAFEKIIVVDSNYKNVRSLLNESKAKLGNQTAAASEINANPLVSKSLIYGLLILLIILALGGFGVFFFKPELLADFYYKRGNLERAAIVFEKILSKRRDNVHATRILALIYFHQKREDAQAIRVYENVISMDLDMPIKSDISTILAYHYLSNGDTDSQKVEILEKVLNQEINKIKSTKG